MDTDVSHEVDRRLTALEEKVGISGETKPVDPDDEGLRPGDGDDDDDDKEEVDAEEEAD